MAEVERLLREYGHEVNDRCPPITVEDVERHLESIAVDERGGDGLTVDYLRQSDDAAATAPRRRLFAVVAATILVAVGVAVAAKLDHANDVSSSPGQTATDAMPGEVASPQEWFRVPHDADVFGGSMMRDVTVGGPGLVAVGATRGAEDPLAAATANTAAVVWTSADGITWARVPHDEAVFGGAVMHTVTAHEKGLVAVGFDAGGYSGALVWTSPDGITWTRLPDDEEVFGGANMWDVTAAGPGLVGVGAGDSGPVAWISADGATWSRVPSDEEVFDAPDTGMFRVTKGGPGLVAVGWDMSTDPDAAVWTSADGVTWSRVPHDEEVFGGEEHATMTGVTAHGTGMVAIGEARTDGIRGAAVWTSTDGITWSRLPNDKALFPGAFMVDVTAVGSLLVAVGESGSALAAWTSVDGIEWSPVVDDAAISGPAALWSVAATETGLVAVGWDQSSGDSVAAVWTN